MSQEEIEQLQFDLEEARIENGELKKDIEDFCFVTTEFLGLMGIDIKSIRDGVEVKKVVKAIKSQLFNLVTDEEGFGAMFSSFAPEALRVGEKYEALAIEVKSRKRQEKGIEQ